MSQRRTSSGQTPPRKRTTPTSVTSPSQTIQSPGETAAPQVRRGLPQGSTPSQSEDLRYYDERNSDQERVRETPDIVLTDYPSTKPITDMSKAPLFFGKPGQFDQVTTWCEISFLTNDELSQDKGKQAATMASLFRGQPLTWLAGRKDKDNLLRNYTLLKDAMAEVWGKSEKVKQSDAARKLAYISQRKNVHGYAMELDDIATTLNLDDATKEAVFKRGLKPHIRAALVSSDGYNGYKELVEEAERIDSELYSIRRTSTRQTFGSTKFAGKCNSCGQFGHKARDCRKGSKRENSDW